MSRLTFRVLYDFSGMDGGELSVKAGQIVMSGTVGLGVGRAVSERLTPVQGRRLLHHNVRQRTLGSPASVRTGLLPPPSTPVFLLF